MSLGNLLGETVWMCPFCDWSVTVDRNDPYDPAGVETALMDHLDETHIGWTLKKIWDELGLEDE